MHLQGWLLIILRYAVWSESNRHHLKNVMSKLCTNLCKTWVKLICILASRSVIKCTLSWSAFQYNNCMRAPIFELHQIAVNFSRWKWNDLKTYVWIKNIATKSAPDYFASKPFEVADTRNLKIAKIWIVESSVYLINRFHYTCLEVTLNQTVFTEHQQLNDTISFRANSFRKIYLVISNNLLWKMFQAFFAFICIMCRARNVAALFLKSHFDSLTLTSKIHLFFVNSNGYELLFRPKCDESQFWYFKRQK